MPRRRSASCRPWRVRSGTLPGDRAPLLDQALAAQGGAVGASDTVSASSTEAAAETDEDEGPEDEDDGPEDDGLTELTPALQAVAESTKARAARRGGRKGQGEARRRREGQVMQAINKTLVELGVREPVNPPGTRIRPTRRRPAKIAGESKAERRLRRRARVIHPSSTTSR